MQGLWDGFEGRGFASWLPSFYEGVASAVGTESKWCSMALPDLHPRLLLSLLSALFSRINKPFRTRLASALVQGNHAHREDRKRKEDCANSVTKSVTCIQRNQNRPTVGSLGPITLQR